MVTTDDAGLAERINQLRNHGASISEEQRHSGPRPYLLADFDVLGYNYRMTDLQAAVGAVQFRKLDRFIDELERWASWYAQQLSDIPWLRLPRALRQSRHGWQAYVTYVDPATAPMPRNDMMQRLQDRGVSTRPGTHAIHMLGYYRNRFGLRTDDLPGARDCNDHTMAIPLHNRMTPEDYEYVVAALRELG
jgi:dTDP-4-amino-4,6-dideoxygalactose transaminase